MKIFKKIEDLVRFALTDNTDEDAICIIRKVSAKEAKTIKDITNKSVEGYEHIIDKSAIKHILKKHGNEKGELSRGQIAITLNDFELAPKILKGENLIFDGYTPDGKVLFLYTLTIGDTYYYVEEVRTGRSRLALKTMFKRKNIKRH